MGPAGYQGSYTYLSRSLAYKTSACAVMILSYQCRVLRLKRYSDIFKVRFLGVTNKVFSHFFIDCTYPEHVLKSDNTFSILLVLSTCCFSISKVWQVFIKFWLGLRSVVCKKMPNKLVSLGVLFWLINNWLLYFIHADTSCVFVLKCPQFKKTWYYFYYSQAIKSQWQNSEVFLSLILGLQYSKLIDFVTVLQFTAWQVVHGDSWRVPFCRC